jgi:hypothetical protein
MRDNYGGVGALLLIIFVLCVVTVWLDMLLRGKHVNPCTANAGNCFSIQGLYSKPDCPGQRAWYVEASDHSFFMGCQS